jgi:exodeoxyribonuclease X
VTDEELARALTMQELLERNGLPGVWPDAGDDGEVVLVGHNLDFDVRMLRQSGVPDAAIPQQRICTLKCAKHLWPDAPAYGNNVLRYWLELRVEDALPPHRALPDATVTAAVLERMMQEKTVEELLELTGRPVLQTTIKFGKYSGKEWKDVDRSYLQWLLDPRRQPPFGEEVLYAARYYLENGARR